MEDNNKTMINTMIRATMDLATIIHKKDTNNKMDIMTTNKAITHKLLKYQRWEI